MSRAHYCGILPTVVLTTVYVDTTVKILLDVIVMAYTICRQLVKVRVKGNGVQERTLSSYYDFTKALSEISGSDLSLEQDQSLAEYEIVC